MSENTSNFKEMFVCLLLLLLLLLSLWGGGGGCCTVIQLSLFFPKCNRAIL